jgi:hypothetical protein
MVPAPQLANPLTHAHLPLTRVCVGKRRAAGGRGGGRVREAVADRVLCCALCIWGGRVGCAKEEGLGQWEAGCGRLGRTQALWCTKTCVRRHVILTLRLPLFPSPPLLPAPYPTSPHPTNHASSQPQTHHHNTPQHTHTHTHMHTYTHAHTHTHSTSPSPWSTRTTPSHSTSSAGKNHENID